MHEMPATQNICDTVVRAATDAGASRVCSVTIKMGAQCDYVPEILQQYFDVISEGTLAEGAKLIVDVIPAKILCKDCGAESESLNIGTICPKCGSMNLKLLAGRECYIENMEIEDDESENDESET